MCRATYILLGTIIILSNLVGVAKAEAMPDIFLTELQTGSADSGSQEFIELYNNSDTDIDFGDSAHQGQASWQLQYFSSTKITQADFTWEDTEPTGSLVLSGAIAAHSYYLISTAPDGTVYAPGGVSPDQTYDSSHFASTAGGVQLIDVADEAVTVHDHVGWSNQDSSADDIYDPPQADGSLQRTVDDEANYSDTSGNLYPWVASSTISPAASWQAPPPEEDPPVDDTDQTPLNDGPETLEITELLPNPASPASDTTDEFVEIHNYGGQTVGLAGFTIQTGMTYAYSHTLLDGTVAPNGYAIFTSGETSLSLSNNAGQARLLNPAGQAIDETAAYDEADAGLAWALIGDNWQWTTTPTPGVLNVLHAPVPKTKTKKVKTAKTKKRAKKSSKTAKGILGTSESGGGGGTVNDQAPVLHPAVLAGVGGAALLYGAYEYRTDLANRLYQLRRYRAARRAARAAAKGA